MPRHEPVSDYWQELLAKILKFIALCNFIPHAGLAGFAWDHLVLLPDVWRNHRDSGSAVKYLPPGTPIRLGWFLPAAARESGRFSAKTLKPGHAVCTVPGAAERVTRVVAKHHGHLAAAAAA